MKLCPKCNTQLEDEYMFCTECGTRLTPEEAPASEQVQVGDSATDVIADAAATPEEIAKVGSLTKDNQKAQETIANLQASLSASTTATPFPIPFLTISPSHR